MLRQFTVLSLTARDIGIGHFAKEVSDRNRKDWEDVLRIRFGYNIKNCGSFVL